MTDEGLRPAMTDESLFPRGAALHARMQRRQRRGTRWMALFGASAAIACIALSALLFNILDQSFGYVVSVNAVEPEQLAIDGVPLEEQSVNALAIHLQQGISAGVLHRLESEQPLLERSREELYDLVVERVVKPEIVATWTLSESLLQRGAVRSQAAEQHPDGRLYFRSWINARFLLASQSSTPATAGVRTALLGSLWMIAITILVAFPLGVGAAIYLEEYARDNAVNRIIQININNLAGVPSIVYGMLGLAIFVRTLSSFTSGAQFGLDAEGVTNGRTILSAALTLALLVLPLIVINAQEAIRAVPTSLRHASYGLGATKWQTTWHHVLPQAMTGILTGTILAISRAIGETAPLVVVGASTFVSLDPTGPFSRFTALPIQVYQWTSRPQAQFRHIAAAAIVVLLVLLLTLNASAVLLRNRLSRSKLS